MPDPFECINTIVRAFVFNLHFDDVDSDVDLNEIFFNIDSLNWDFIQLDDEILFYAHSVGGHSLVNNADYIAATTSSKIIIERAAKKLRLTIYSSRPGIIIGKKGIDIETLKNKLTEMSKLEVYKDMAYHSLKKILTTTAKRSTGFVIETIVFSQITMTQI